MRIILLVSTLVTFSALADSVLLPLPVEHVIESSPARKTYVLNDITRINDIASSSSSSCSQYATNREWRSFLNDWVDVPVCVSYKEETSYSCNTQTRFKAGKQGPDFIIKLSGSIEETSKMTIVSKGAYFDSGCGSPSQNSPTGRAGRAYVIPAGMTYRPDALIRHIRLEDLKVFGSPVTLNYFETKTGLKLGPTSVVDETYYYLTDSKNKNITLEWNAEQSFDDYYEKSIQIRNVEGKWLVDALVKGTDGKNYLDQDLVYDFVVNESADEVQLSITGVGSKSKRVKQFVTETMKNISGRLVKDSNDELFVEIESNLAELLKQYPVTLRFGIITKNSKGADYALFPISLSKYNIERLNIRFQGKKTLISFAELNEKIGDGYGSLSLNQKRKKKLLKELAKDKMINLVLRLEIKEEAPSYKEYFTTENYFIPLKSPVSLE